MMLLKDFMQSLDAAVPFSLQEAYDNSGLQVGSPEQRIHRGLVTLDVTPGVVREAVSKECDLILSHHPLIFKGLQRITGASQAEEVIVEAIRNRIAVVAVHTNLDNIRHGVNHRLGTKLGLKEMRILKPAKGLLKKLVTFCPLEQAEKVRAALFQAGAGHIGDYDCCSFNLSGKGSFRAGEDANPFVGNIKELHYEQEERIETIFPAYLQHKVVAAMKASHPYEEVAYDIYPLDNEFEMVGSGMTGKLEEPLTVKAFLELVKHSLGIPFLKHSATGREPIHTVAICGGSGAFLLDTAIKTGAQAFITGDVKYHQYFDAGSKLLLVDAGHYETEQHACELLVDIVKKKMINFELLISEVNTNPVRYY